MCESIREFGFKIPCLVRGDGEIVDGHLRLKAARKLGITEIPVILCDEWTPAQVKAFRLMVNRSVTWADWDEELLALELHEIQESDFDLSLTGFDPGEIDGLLALEDDEKANAAPPLPESPVSRLGDLWLLGPHRALCADATSAEAVRYLAIATAKAAEDQPRHWKTPGFPHSRDGKLAVRSSRTFHLECIPRKSSVSVSLVARI